MLHPNASARSPWLPKPWNLDSLSLQRMARGVDQGDREADMLRYRVSIYESEIQANWPVAQPCPVRAWSTLFGYVVQRPSTATTGAHLDLALNQVPAGVKVVPVKVGLTELIVITSSARNYTFKSYGEAMIQVQVYGNGPGNITLTFTIGGAGGYTVTRELIASRKTHYEHFFVPVPYDDGTGRPITVSWTGGAATCTAWGAYYTFVPVASSVPAGWNASIPEAAHRIGQIGQTAGTGNGSGSTSHASIRTFWGRSTDYALQDYSGDFWGLAFNTVGSLGHVDNRTLLQSYDWRTEYAEYAAFRPYVGLPGANADGPTMHQVGPLVTFGAFSGVTASEGFVRAVRTMTAYLYSDSAVTGIAWKLQSVDYVGGYLTATDLTTGTWDHPGGGWVARSITLPSAAPWDPLPGRRKRVCVYLSFSGVFFIVATEDPTPLPFSIPCTDGTVCPGATHPNSTAMAKGAAIVEAVYPSALTFAALPSGLGAWAGRFSGVPDGLYVLYATDSGGTPVGPKWLPIWGESECVPFNDLFNKASAVIVRSGNLYFAIGPNSSYLYWGNLNKGKNSGSQVISASQIMPHKITVAPFPLAAGANVLGSGVNQASFGVSGVDASVFANGRHFIFASFTAPADGTYSFTTSPTMGWFPARLALWWSATDPECLHMHPDSAQVAAVPGYISLSSVATTPPTPSSTVYTKRSYAIGAGATGEWAGKEGWIAYGEDLGAGGPIEWRFTDPPIGTVVYAGGFYEKAKGAWVGHAMPSATRVMASGETVYFRIGYINAAESQDGRGFGFPVYSGYTSSVTVTVSAA